MAKTRGQRAKEFAKEIKMNKIKKKAAKNQQLQSRRQKKKKNLIFKIY